MNQIDFFGSTTAERPFRDIRNTRPSAAEEKAALCLELSRLCSTVPPSVRNGSINATRAWLEAQKTSRATAAKVRASVVELGLAIKTMRGFL